MDRLDAFTGRMIAYGGLTSLGGLALIASVIFVGAGVVLLAVGLLLLILGLGTRAGVLGLRGVSASMKSEARSGGPVASRPAAS